MNILGLDGLNIFKPRLSTVVGVRAPDSDYRPRQISTLWGGGWISFVVLID